MLILILISLAVGYLLGSLPFGYFIARAYGVNIFEVGSRNPGATNVMRVLGPKAGYPVFALDALKGAVAAAWPALLFVRLGGASAAVPAMQLAGVLGAILGHTFSCFTKFKGGKGVATAAGGLIVVMPLSVLVALATWIVLFLASRYVSLASVCAAAALPLTSWFFYRRSIFYLGAAVALLVIVNHRANLVRLAKGTENRFVKKAKTTA